MNRMSPLDAAATLGSLNCSSSSLEEEEFSPAQALSLHVEEFLKERVLQNGSLKPLSPDKVAIFCKLGGALVSYSPKDLSGLTDEEKGKRINDLCAEAIDRLNHNLSGRELTRDSVLTVYAIFLQHMGSSAAVHAVKGSCSTRNYNNVTRTIAPRLSTANAHAFVKAQYTAGSTAGPQDEMMSFLFPIRVVLQKGKGLVKKIKLPDVINL